MTSIQFAPRRRLGVLFGLSVSMFVVTLGLGGCALFGGGGGDSAPSVKKYTLTLIGGEKLNSCGGDFGSALKVRVFQLESDAKFSLLGRSQLWGAKPTDFAGELLGEIQEVVLEPGKTLPLELEVQEGAGFLAVAANFCDTEGDCWRWLQPVVSLASKTSLTFGEKCIEPTP